jgi:DNA repair protein RecO (recombination protein O)
VSKPPILQGYVLHHYEWSESSLILDVFTREQGRLALVAKGARRPYSQLRAVLLPFQRLHLALVRSSSPNSRNSEDMTTDIQTLRSAEWAGGPAMLTGAALFSGFYLNELLMRLLVRHDADAALFDAYAQTLPSLAEAQDALVQTSLRAFELKLLQALGVLPDLSLVTLTLQPVEVRHHYTLEPQAGVLALTVPHASPTLPGQAFITLHAALLHGSLAALQQACAAHLPELKTMLRSLLHYHLGTSLMRTRQLMQDIQALER